MVKVLFDHNMPPAIAYALHEIIKVDGHEAVALRDKFNTDISDIDYFTQLGEEKDWVVISKDLKNSKRRAERDAIMHSGVLAFYLVPGVQKQKITRQAASILWQWDKICDKFNTEKNGLFMLPVNKGSQFKNL